MRTISFHKLAKNICLYCKKNPTKRWNMRCDSCKLEKQLEGGDSSQYSGLGIGHRQPAAVIKTADGREAFVDKFGKEVDNPGYDLKGDARGWKKTQTIKPKTII